MSRELIPASYGGPREGAVPVPNIPGEPDVTHPHPHPHPHPHSHSHSHSHPHTHQHTHINTHTHTHLRKDFERGFEVLGRARSELFLGAVPLPQPHVKEACDVALIGHLREQPLLFLMLHQTASKRKGSNFSKMKDLCIKAKARIWP